MLWRSEVSVGVLSVVIGHSATSSTPIQWLAMAMPVGSHYGTPTDGRDIGPPEAIFLLLIMPLTYDFSKAGAQSNVIVADFARSPKDVGTGTDV